MPSQKSNFFRITTWSHVESGWVVLRTFRFRADVILEVNLNTQRKKSGCLEKTTNFLHPIFQNKSGFIGFYVAYMCIYMWVYVKYFSKNFPRLLPTFHKFIVFLPHLLSCALEVSSWSTSRTWEFLSPSPVFSELRLLLRL